MILYKHEMKMNRKSLCIWTLSVGLLCFGCILLYTSLEDSIQGIADSFSDMGAMSAALGMDKMSLATLKGYYATEIAMMHSLGGAMFAAILGTGLLAKEESGHTAEFLMQLEVGTICFFLSACVKKSIMGAGLGLTLLLFAADMMCRIVPAIEEMKYVTPFYYANAADIFTEGKINGVMMAAGAGIIVVSYAAARWVYCRKDFA